jgi:Nif-specific regulatory protein
MAKPVRRISTTAIQMMSAYHWPGNVRELENCIEYAVLVCREGVIHGQDLPPTLQMPNDAEVGSPGSLKARIRILEKDAIMDALKHHNGNVTAAAKSLGLTPRMVRYKIQQMGIETGTPHSRKDPS